MWPSDKSVMYKKYKRKKKKNKKIELRDMKK